MQWEAIIASDAAINAETDSLEVISPTSLTIREGYGKAVITHAMVLADTDDVYSGDIIPSGYKDSGGMPIPYVGSYAATLGFNLEYAKLPNPVEVDEGTVLDIQVTSDTAANSNVFAWVVVKYPRGEFQDVKPNAGAVSREANAGGALTSNTQAAGTAITNLQSGRKYQLAAISGVGVDGQTAGVVGPAFMKIDGPSEYPLETWIPLPNSPQYCTNESICDLARADLEMPVFSKQDITPWFLSYTAEQPEVRLHLITDKVL